MRDPVVLVAVLATLVPVVVGALAYLGTRGSTRVEQEKRLDAREEAAYKRLEAERDRIAAALAACEAREAAGRSAAAANFAADMVIDGAVAEAEAAQNKRREQP